MMEKVIKNPYSSKISVTNNFALVVYYTKISVISLQMLKVILLLVQQIAL